jgi:hypothetical protein
VLEYDTSTQTVNSTPAAHYEYDPYGNLINDISSQAYGPDNPFRFSTKWHDTELPGNTLVYYGDRRGQRVYCQAEPFPDANAPFPTSSPEGSPMTWHALSQP